MYHNSKKIFSRKFNLIFVKYFPPFYLAFSSKMYICYPNTENLVSIDSTISLIFNEFKSFSKYVKANTIIYAATKIIENTTIICYCNFRATKLLTMIN